MIIKPEMYEENVRGIIYSYITSNIFLFSFIHALPQLSFLSVQVVRPWIWPSCKTQVSEARWFKIWQGHRYGDNNDWQVSRLTTKLTEWLCTQRRRRLAWASAQSDQSLRCVLNGYKDPSFLHAYSEDPDETRRMPRLICVFAGRTCHFVSFVMRRFKLASLSSVTVKILKTQTPEIFAVTTLKFEQGAFTIE